MLRDAPFGVESRKRCGYQGSGIRDQGSGIRKVRD
jgi:hypothetical protein